MTDWADEIDEPPQTVDASTSTSDEPEVPELYFGSTDEFVQWLRFAYRRKVDGTEVLWAARWWEYDEAVMRLEALWRAWEHLRQDPAMGMTVWWRDHADHHMEKLMHKHGPFRGVDPQDDANKSKAGEPLPYEAPPPGLFPDVRESGRPDD